MPSVSPFNLAMQWLFSAEGGYSNHSADKGGETNFGIADKADGLADGKTDINGDGIPDVAIRDLTKDQAEEKYLRDYWLAARCDQVAVINVKLAIALFDAAVNHGVGRGVKLLQQAAQVPADGVLGAKSISAISRNSYLLRTYLDTRKNFYLSICQKDQSQIRFRNGWLNRLKNIETYLNRLPG